MRHASFFTIAAVAVAALAQANPATAAEKNWWPIKIYDFDSGTKKVVEYSPLQKAAKPWNICVLFPHMKDTFWVAVDYGVVEEAKREGVNMTLYQAGGYENLPKQLSQFDDCLAGNFDAIIVGPISEAGLTKGSPKGMASGKLDHQHRQSGAESKHHCQDVRRFTTMGEQTGDYLIGYLDGKEAKVGPFQARPAPAGPRTF